MKRKLAKNRAALGENDSARSRLSNDRDISHRQGKAAIERALAEDVGAGDITTDSCISADLQAEARFFAQQAMIVAGVELLLRIVFEDAINNMNLKNRSGDRVMEGEELAIVGASGTISCSLAATVSRQVSSNFSCSVSLRIATLAARFAAAVDGTGVRKSSIRAQNHAGIAYARKNGRSSRRSSERSS